MRLDDNVESTRSDETTFNIQLVISSARANDDLRMAFLLGDRKKEIQLTRRVGKTCGGKP